MTTPHTTLDDTGQADSSEDTQEMKDTQEYAAAQPGRTDGEGRGRSNSSEAAEEIWGAVWQKIQAVVERYGDETRTTRWSMYVTDPASVRGHTQEEQSRLLRTKELSTLSGFEIASLRIMVQYETRLALNLTSLRISSMKAIDALKAECRDNERNISRLDVIAPSSLAPGLVTEFPKGEKDLENCAVPPSRTIIMSESIELTEGDHILEPVEEAVAMYEDLLTDLRKFLEEHEPQSEASNTMNLPAVTVGDSTQNILDGPAGRPFIKLASRPGHDSLDAFNLIMAKITAQTISTSNAMLPHTIFKISKHPETRATNPDTMKNATTAELFDTICPRLEVGNQFHTAFKRVGRTTLYGLERLEALNEEWQKLWLEGLKDFEPMTIWLTTKHIKMGLQNLDGTMKNSLRLIHAYQASVGW
ncbi:hypothetical protein D6C84_06358 [Aureobasidium pullulans]|uniref:Uncharacterized protein n=1 Tax=Aureobasidium pullulans TaxID=5580 RepID=A0A4S9XPA2_AURPU|nr:hypothetical protein D6C84_06358 [Aureobasidium pullulans]